MGWGDEEIIKGEFPWEDDYVRRENFDGSKSICRPGLLGRRGRGGREGDRELLRGPEDH